MGKPVEDDTWDWKEFHQGMKERRRLVRSRNTLDNERFIQEVSNMPQCKDTQGISGGVRFTFEHFMVDFWPPSGKWWIVGEPPKSKKGKLLPFPNGGRKMISAIRDRLRNRNLT